MLYDARRTLTDRTVEKNRWGWLLWDTGVEAVDVNMNRVQREPFVMDEAVLENDYDDACMNLHTG